MSQITVGVNLIGDFATSDEIKKNKSLIEDIINLITTTICDAEKKDDVIPLISTIKNIIKNRFSNYDELCVKTPGAGTKCDPTDILFTDKRILDIIEKIRNNTEYRRICKFKHSALNGYLQREVLRKVLASLNRYPIGYYNLPYAPMSYAYLYPFTGGNRSNDTDTGKYGLGTININGETNSIGFVDFDSFVDQYEKYHTPKNNRLYIKSCESINGKMNCSSKTYKIDDTYDSELDSDSEDFNVLTNGKNKKLDDAYKALFNFLIKDTNQLLDKIDGLLDYLKYYVVPLKTLEKAEQVNAKISQK